MITGNYVLAAMILVPMAVLVAARLPREERMMLDHFGKGYRTYMRRTGRLLPRLGGTTDQRGDAPENAS